MPDPKPLTPAERAALAARHEHRGYEFDCQIQRILATVAALDAQRDAYAVVVRAARAWAAAFPDAPAMEPWFTPWRALHAAVAALPAED